MVDVKWCKYSCLKKRQRKPKGQSRIDNLEKLATLGTQDTGGRQTRQKIKDEQHGPHQNPGVNPCVCKG